MRIKKKKLIINYDKFKYSNLFFNNNFKPLSWSFAKNQRYISIQMFKNKNIYVGITSSSFLN